MLQCTIPHHIGITLNKCHVTQQLHKLDSRSSQSHLPAFDYITYSVPALLDQAVQDRITQRIAAQHYIRLQHNGLTSTQDKHNYTK